MKTTQWLDDTDAALADAAHRFLQARYRFEARMQQPASQRRFDAGIWTAVAEMGWCAVAVDESLGGLGYRPSSIVLLAQAAGQALMAEPLISSGIMPARLLAACSPGTARDRLLEDALQGRQCIVVTPMLPPSAANGHTLTADLPWVPDADIAQTLLVPVHGGALYAVEAGSPGLSLQALPLVDGRGAATLALRSCPAVPLAPLAPGALAQACAQAQQLACLGVAADSVGVMQGALALTLDYLKTRKQFGVTLGQHQVLQHRAVDMYIQLAESESVVRQAMRSLACDAPDRATQIHAAKAVACDSARRVTQEAVQLHGGIGITEEYAISHYLRRARVNEQLHGSTEHHFKAFTTAAHPTAHPV